MAGHYTWSTFIDDGSEVFNSPAQVYAALVLNRPL